MRFPTKMKFMAVPNGGRRETKNCHAYQSHLHQQVMELALLLMFTVIFHRLHLKDACLPTMRGLSR